jgi:hypothetical protein
MCSQTSRQIWFSTGSLLLFIERATTSLWLLGVLRGDSKVLSTTIFTLGSKVSIKNK